MKNKLSHETLRLLKQMETELMKCLPSDKELKKAGAAPLRLKVRQEWADCMLEILCMMDYIICLDQNYTMPHKLKEIGAIAEMTSERVRQIEMHGLKKIRNLLPRSEYRELQKAMIDYVKTKDDKITTFTSPETGGGEVYSTPYDDPNGKAYA